MGEEQFFGVVASLALLVWLLGRGVLPDARGRRLAEIAAMGLVAAAIIYAGFRSLAFFLG